MQFFVKEHNKRTHICLNRGSIPGIFGFIPFHQWLEAQRYEWPLQSTCWRKGFSRSLGKSEALVRRYVSRCTPMRVWSFRNRANLPTADKVEGSKKREWRPKEADESDGRGARREANGDLPVQAWVHWPLENRRARELEVCFESSSARKKEACWGYGTFSFIIVLENDQLKTEISEYKQKIRTLEENVRFSSFFSLHNI